MLNCRKWLQINRTLFQAFADLSKGRRQPGVATAGKLAVEALAVQPGEAGGTRHAALCFHHVPHGARPILSLNRIIAEEPARRGWQESELAARRRSDPGKLASAARLRS